MAEARTRIRKSPMSRVDTAWLRMERPTNLMMITGVMMFETPLDIKTLRKVIEQKFLSYPRFRQKAVDTPTGAFWQDDADFDLDWHVRLTALPGKGGKKELERLKSSVSVERLAEAMGVKLKRLGKDLHGLCPFHRDREPSLVITPSTNLWNCLGACRKGGSSIDWVMRAQGVSFRHAVELMREDLVGPAPVGGLKRSTTKKLPSPVG